MNPSLDFLNEHRELHESVRILTGTTNAGKQAVYISGNPGGLRMLAKLIEAQANAIDSSEHDRHSAFTKFDRDGGSLFFATDDSVDLFEIHCADHYPERHD